MPCYHPVAAYRTENGDLFFGSVPERFRLAEHRFRVEALDLPCGQCVGCRLERSRQWAVRCVHEASLFRDNCFITLTYDPANLPVGGSLCYADFQRFLKRLRRRFSGTTIRFFAGGEYGENFGRPHFHACIFGFDFPDRTFLFTSPSGARVDRSPLLESLWPSGFCSVGDVTFESAAYVARYVMGKVTGPSAAAHYTFLDPETGELIERVPEFCHMSLKPGIGSAWYERYRSDLFPHDYVVVNGSKCSVPRYYSKKFEKDSPLEFADLKLVREARSRVRLSDSTDRRLSDAEIVKTASMRSLVRKLD